MIFKAKRVSKRSQFLIHLIKEVDTLKKQNIKLSKALKQSEQYFNDNLRAIKAYEAENIMLREEVRARDGDASNDQS